MKFKLFITTLSCFLLLNCQSQVPLKPENKNVFELNQEITTGVLENGLTYFVQENAKPENRIELRLIVNTGSIQEDDDQKGLAHFVEHMAFNGTKNFEKDRLVKYLESLGMGFGPEINASTSFDETIYKLSIPADDPEVLKNALLILEDWAHGISFDDREIEKERGVIVEEWRGGRGVQGRFLDKFFPVLLDSSRYAQRLPIGDMDIIKNSDPQKLRDYYNEWYRPELMSVAVVGNINKEEVIKSIQENFNFTNDNKGRERISYPTPIIDRVAVELISDPEISYSLVSLYNKFPGKIVNTEENYKDSLTEILAVLMFNSRMEEIYTKPNSPFLYAGSGFVPLVRDISILVFQAQVEDGKTESGFKALLEEIEKVKQNGFTQEELDRSKALIKMIMENQVNERDNRESGNLISEIVKYYLEGSTVLDITDENELVKKLLVDINFSEVNKKSIKLFSGIDKTLTVQTPVNEESTKLTEENFKKLFKEVSDKTYEARKEESIDRPLFDKNPTPGEILSVKENIQLGVTTLKLSNGITVVLKPTDFKADEINLSAISYGGLSLVDDSEFISGNISASLVQMSGINGFDSIELGRLLTGKNVSVSPWIGSNEEGFSGQSSVVDFEIMLQLINLYFTNPEFNPESYDVILTNVKSYIQNRENSPETIFNDRINEILGSGHFRSKPITLESLNDVDFEEVKNLYLERFNNPADFYFVLTGNFNNEEIKPLLNKYLGSLQTTTQIERAKDLGIKQPTKIIEEIISKGIDEKSVVEILFNGSFDGTEEDEFALSLLSNYLEEQLRVLIREELSGTYGVSVFNNINLYPTKDYIFGIYFGCEPGREDELTNALFSELEKVRNGYIDQAGVDAVITNFKRNMELNLKDNNYWLNSITNVTLLNRDYKSITDTDTSYITADKFIELTNKYLIEDRFVKVILQPQN